MHDEALIRFALDSGADAAAMVAAAAIVIDDALAELCTPAACSFYGLAAGCPPRVGGPEAFRSRLRIFRSALVIRLEVPVSLLKARRCEAWLRRLHCIAAAVERRAKAMGAAGAEAFAGGSCKPLFCPGEPDCAVVARNAPCLHPECARPSMSGFGVDVARLMAAAGREFTPVTADSPLVHPPTAPVCALVLVEHAGGRP